MMATSVVKQNLKEMDILEEQAHKLEEQVNELVEQEKRIAKSIHKECERVFKVIAKCFGDKPMYIYFPIILDIDRSSDMELGWPKINEDKIYVISGNCRSACWKTKNFNFNESLPVKFLDMTNAEIKKEVMADMDKSKDNAKDKSKNKYEVVDWLESYIEYFWDNRKTILADDDYSASSAPFNVNDSIEELLSENLKDILEHSRTKASFAKRIVAIVTNDTIIVVKNNQVKQ